MTDIQLVKNIKNTMLTISHINRCNGGEHRNQVELPKDYVCACKRLFRQINTLSYLLRNEHYNTHAVSNMEDVVFDYIEFGRNTIKHIKPYFRAVIRSLIVDKMKSIFYLHGLQK